MLTAMRTLTAAARLLPSDARISRKRRQLHAQVKATAVPFEGRTLTLPVWVPRQHVAPSDAGSADDITATFFRWQRIPVFRNDSVRCSVHQTPRRWSTRTMPRPC